MSYWFGGPSRLVAIRMQARNLHNPLPPGPEHSRSTAEVQKFLEWVEYRDWLAAEAALWVELVRGRSEIVVGEAPKVKRTRPRPAVESI